jgi:Fe-S metabolism associated domain
VPPVPHARVDFRIRLDLLLTGAWGAAGSTLPHIRSHTQRQYIARKLIGGLAIISQKDASCRSVEIRWNIQYIRDAGAPPGRGRREAMTIDEIIDNFSLLDDWDDRYRYAIELGRGLAPLDEWDRNQAGKV